LRKQVVANFFPEQAAESLPEGTKNFELGEGWKLKALFKCNYNLASEGIDAALNHIRDCGETGPFLADRLVTWKAALSLREYKALDGVTGTKIKQIINGVLTITPASPSLEIVPPKARK
jgi:hypothetical protein